MDMFWLIKICPKPIWTAARSLVQQQLNRMHEWKSAFIAWILKKLCSDGWCYGSGGQPLTFYCRDELTSLFGKCVMNQVQYELVCIFMCTSVHAQFSGVYSWVSLVWLTQGKACTTCDQPKQTVALKNILWWFNRDFNKIPGFVVCLELKKQSSLWRTCPAIMHDDWLVFSLALVYQQ